MSGWSTDFSYEYYQRLLEILRWHYNVVPVSEATDILPCEQDDKICFLRHDIDVSPGKTLWIARLEHDMGLTATYTVRTNSKFYSLNAETVGILKSLVSLGHEIGLHYYEPQDGNADAARKKLRRAIAEPVQTISFHNPPAVEIPPTLMYHGMVNAYAPVLTRWYMSDSKGVWRDGDPSAALAEPKGTTLQILTHPIWWGKKTIDEGEKAQTLQRIKDGW